TGKIAVIMQGLSGETKTIDLCDTDEQMQRMTVKQLRGKIAEKIPGQGADDLRMIFTNKRLDDDSALLSSHGIVHRSVIQLVILVPGGLAS
uniref:Ubiquitin-like domain-containing protein n=1 Tax=Seriola lalandi dorsalis TaxID=1841481 RepID=A0A3B4WQ10_SERLL